MAYPKFDGQSMLEGEAGLPISLGTTLRAAHVPELLAAAKVAATSALAPGSEGTVSGVQGSSEWRLLVQETPGDFPARREGGQSCPEVTRGASAGRTECCSFPVSGDPWR